MVFLSSHGEKDYWNIPYEEELFLVFGKESSGLSQTILEENKESTFKIPLFSEHVRSLNLANAVGIVVYDGIKAIR